MALRMAGAPEHAGGSPSAELVGKSGYESEYVRALENYYKQQAAQQSAAGGYVREGSFHLDVNADHFLYESTTKRKIENNTQKK